MATGMCLQTSSSCYKAEARGSNKMSKENSYLHFDGFSKGVSLFALFTDDNGMPLPEPKIWLQKITK
jgi:hypothetical protein